MKHFKNTPEAMKLWRDGAMALSRIEHVGIKVDETYLDAKIEECKHRVRDGTNQLREHKHYRLIKKRFGDKANVGSRPQLAWLVFDELGHTSTSTTDKGKVSADEAAFDGINEPYVKLYLEVERLKKAVSTYLLGIKRETVNGRVHPSYNLNTAATYRSSADHPNIQNQPARIPWLTEMIRRSYIPSHPDWVISEIDFSQLEVRIACTYHGDPAMQKYIRDTTTCMHRDSAKQLFLVDQWDDKAYKKTLRDSAKNQFVFPEFYGSVYFQCAPQIWNRMVRQEFKHTDGRLMQDYLKTKGISELGNCDPEHLKKHGTEKGTFVHHLKMIEKDLWEKRFPVYAAWKKTWYNEYLKNGGFMMKTGFAVNQILGRNDVINYPVQGSAFHCLMWCMIKVVQWLERSGLKTRVVAEIHDCMVLDGPAHELPTVMLKLREIMTVDLLKAWRWINIPLEVEAEASPAGASWFEKKGIPWDTLIAA